mgnify:FL=1
MAADAEDSLVFEDSAAGNRASAIREMIRERASPALALLLLLPASAVADLPIIVELFRRIVFNAAASGSGLFFVASTMSSS